MFFDEKYQKVRLLQYIDNMNNDNSLATISCTDNTKESIEWIGDDYTMDSINPLSSKWKLKFIDSPQNALQFMILFNYHINLLNKTKNESEFIQELTCNICYELINDTKLLFCGHIGCNKCINEWIQSTKNNENGATCPSCRYKINLQNDHKPISCPTIDFIIKHRKKLLKSKKKRQQKHPKQQQEKPQLQQQQSHHQTVSIPLNNDELSTELYCICNQPYSSSDTYICCDYCDKWYHPQCVGIEIDKLNKIEKYKCPFCESQETANMANILNMEIMDSTENNNNHQHHKCDDNNCNNVIDNDNGISYNELNEILIAEVPIKAIYIWDEDTSGWKKRVIDTKLQFFKNINNNKHRLIARDSETLQLKIDQFIYDFYRNTLQMKSKKSYSWCAMDSILQKEYAIHKRIPFAAKFYTEEDAKDFELYYSSNNNDDDELNDDNQHNLHHLIDHQSNHYEDNQSLISDTVNTLSMISELSRLPPSAMKPSDDTSEIKENEQEIEEKEEHKLQSPSWKQSQQLEQIKELDENNGNDDGDGIPNLTEIVFMDENKDKNGEDDDNEEEEQEVIIMESEEGDNDDHNDDPYEEWKNASIITMKENVRKHNMDERQISIEKSVNKSFRNTLSWLSNISITNITRNSNKNIEYSLDENNTFNVKQSINV